MSLPWFFEDVPFDPGAAVAAVAAIDAAIRALEDATAERWRAGAEALEPCRGPFADQLAASLSQFCVEGAGLVDDLVALRARVVTAAAEAAAEQRWRDDLRSTWAAELERDRVRAAHSAEAAPPVPLTVGATTQPGFPGAGGDWDLIDIGGAWRSGR